MITHDPRKALIKKVIANLLIPIISSAFVVPALVVPFLVPFVVPLGARVTDPFAGFPVVFPLPCLPVVFPFACFPVVFAFAGLFVGFFV